MQLAWIVALSLLVDGLPEDAQTPIRIETTIRGSVDASLRRLAPSHGAALAAQVARLLRWKGDIIRDVHPDDRLVVLFVPGDEQPEMVAVLYEGSAIELAAYRFPAPSSGRSAEDDDTGRFYDADGTLIEPVIEASPTEYAQITETVQRGRGKRRHNGIDLKGPEGTPVALPYDAVISRVNWHTRTNGNCLEMVYKGGPAKGRLARFLHLTHVDDSIRAGKRYPAGTVVGGLGNTGRSSAPHLHYEIRDNRGRPISPLKAHGTRVGRIDEGQRHAFAALVAHYRAHLTPPPAIN